MSATHVHYSRFAQLHIVLAGKLAFGKPLCSITSTTVLLTAALHSSAFDNTLRLLIVTVVLSDSIDISIIILFDILRYSFYYRNSESALAPATIVGLLAMKTACNQLLVVSFLVLTLDIVDLPFPKTV